MLQPDEKELQNARRLFLRRDADWRRNSPLRVRRSGRRVAGEDGNSRDSDEENQERDATSAHGHTSHEPSGSGVRRT
jgi:hypothetical protein